MHSMDSVVIYLGRNAVRPFVIVRTQSYLVQLKSAIVFYKALCDPFISIVKNVKKNIQKKGTITPWNIYAVQIAITRLRLSK